MERGVINNIFHVKTARIKKQNLNLQHRNNEITGVLKPYFQIPTGFFW